VKSENIFKKPIIISHFVKNRVVSKALKWTRIIKMKKNKKIKLIKE